MKPIIYILSILLFIGTNENEEAKKLLESYVSEMGDVRLPKEGNTYYLNMTVKNQFRQNEDGPALINFEAYLTRNQLRYNSDLLSIYQDSSEVWAIVHSAKTIYLSDAEEDWQKNYTTNNLTGVQLELIKTGKILSVHQDKNNDALLNIVLQPQVLFTKNTRIEQVVFLFNKKLHTIKKIQIKYGLNHQIESQEFIYNALELNHENTEESPVRSYIFKKSGELIEKYQGYQIIDNRS
nr:hypothetical protein [uncultured Draconibacterium sp.]